MGYIRLFIENEKNHIPIEIKRVCKQFLGALIDSNILKMSEESSLLTFIDEQTKKNWNWTLIYRGSEHGFKRDDFYKNCEDKSNTVVIVHNEYDQVFGGYTPCPWKCNQEQSTKYGKDDTLTTFVFILRGYSSPPKMFKLKEGSKDAAVCYLYNTAFDFGHNDFFLYEQRISAYSGCCFEWDSEDSYFLGGPEIISRPLDIEIYQLQCLKNVNSNN